VVVGSFLVGVDFPPRPERDSGRGTNLVTTSNPPSLESKYVSENAFRDAELPIDPYGIGNFDLGRATGARAGVERSFREARLPEAGDDARGDAGHSGCVAAQNGRLPSAYRSYRAARSKQRGGGWNERFIW